MTISHAEMSVRDVSKEKTMQYIRIFRKKDDEEDFFRYWASISTEKTDKDGKGTGKYHRANIPVRMSKKAIETFEANMSKTKTKGIKQLNGKIEGWLKAFEPEEGNPYVYLFINSIEPAQDEEDDE